MISCGIPSITLLGTKDDYLTIFQRLDKLNEFGQESTIFARLLRPILTQFVTAFDMVEGGKTPDPNFWGKICHYHQGGCGPSYISGWIAAFCVWDKKGKWQGVNIDTIEQPLTEAEKLALEQTNSRHPEPLVLDGLQYFRIDTNSRHPGPLVLDGLRYPRIDTDQIPPGSCEVDIKLNDNGEQMDSVIVAGHVGNTVSASGPEGIMDTLQPQAEWFMFVKEDRPRPRYSFPWSLAE
jgi:hypothetical protein